MTDKTKSYMLAYEGKVLCWKVANSVQEAIEKLASELSVSAADKFEDRHVSVKNTYTPNSDGVASPFK